MKVELTVRETNGAILSVVDSVHPRYKEAKIRAAELASAWATRYGMPQLRQSGMFWTIGNASGITVAQVAIRD